MVTTRHSKYSRMAIISYHRHHWWWCTFFKRVTFFAQRAQNFGQFCCEFSHFFVHFYRAWKCGGVPKLTNIMYVFTLQECSLICCRERIIQKYKNIIIVLALILCRGRVCTRCVLIWEYEYLCPHPLSHQRKVSTLFPILLMWYDFEFVVRYMRGSNICGTVNWIEWVGLPHCMSCVSWICQARIFVKAGKFQLASQYFISRKLRNHLM